VPDVTPTPMPTPLPDTPTDPDTPTPTPSPTPTPTPDVPSSDDEPSSGTTEPTVVPADTEATPTGTTDPANSKDGDDSHILLLIIGILSGILVTIIALYCLCKNKFGNTEKPRVVEYKKVDKNPQDVSKERFLNINGSANTSRDGGSTNSSR
jgi:hypothetical protein